MLTSEERREKLERLMEKHPNIDRAAHLEDLDLCKKYLDGDRQPFEVMFKTAYDKLERYVYYDKFGKHLGIHVNKQDKEDLIADVVSVAIKRMATFQGWSKFSTWMIAIARYQIIDFIKKRCHEQKNMINDALDDSRIFYQPQNDSIAVWETLSCLSEQDSAIVKLKVIEQFTYPEIAENMNLSIKQVKYRYNAAIKMLRDTR